MKQRFNLEQIAFWFYSINTFSNGFSCWFPIELSSVFTSRLERSLKRKWTVVAHVFAILTILIRFSLVFLIVRSRRAGNKLNNWILWLRETAASIVSSSTDLFEFYWFRYSHHECWNSNIIDSRYSLCFLIIAMISIWNKLLKETVSLSETTGNFVLLSIGLLQFSLFAFSYYTYRISFLRKSLKQFERRISHRF